MSTVIWHDVENAGYVLDLPLWRELAAAHLGPVLDVGAGTGRVALGLAAVGHEVVAVDVEPELIAALRERADAAGLAIDARVADARTLDLGDARFTIAIVPMQTVQLLGGAAGRLAFLHAVKRHLRPGALLALAIADATEAFDEDDHMMPPIPDMREIDGVVYASRPISIRDLGERGAALDRLREIVHADGTHTTEQYTIELDLLDAPTLEAEAREAGFRVLPRREVAATDEYVGSTVVMLGA